MQSLQQSRSSVTKKPVAPDSAELWLPVPGWEAYQVSDLGNVRSRWKRIHRSGGGTRFVLGDDWKEMRPKYWGAWTPRVDLAGTAGETRCAAISALVLEAFVGPCPDGMKCIHYPDPDKRNCALANLDWGNLKDDCREFVPGPDDQESWKPVPDWPSYEVSDWGRVRSVRRGRRRIIGNHVAGKADPSGRFHRNATLTREDGAKRQVGVHVLVLEAFVGPRPEGMEACHNNGDPEDNRIENLRWDTPSANQQDSLRHGARKHQKLNEGAVADIWRRLIAGETSASIARDYRPSKATVALIKTGKTWTHVTRSLPGWPILPEDRNDKEPIYIADEFAKTDEEVWRPIPDWPAYRVSNFGRVQSCWGEYGKGKVRRLVGDVWRDRVIVVNNHGRPTVWLGDGAGKTAVVRVHACVLAAFVGPRPSGMICCHDDGNPLNNHASNLRYDTPKANMQDRVRHAKLKKSEV